MADPQSQSSDQGFLPGLLGKVRDFFPDPAAAYGGLLSDEATRRAFAWRELGAAAGAFSQGAMPVPYKGGIPFGATLGAAGAAASTAGDALMHARLEQAQADLAQQQGLLAHANVQGLAMNNSLYPVALGLDGKGGSGTGADGKLTGPAKIIAGGGGALAGNADPNIIKNVLAITNQRGYTPVATTALVGAGLGEGGFAKPWAPSGVADANSPTGQELSYGPWQLHKGGELDGYLQAGNKPGDINAQTNYVADRLDVFAKKLGYQDFGSITDPKAAANVVRAFENGKPGADYYASHFPAAANLIAQHSGAQTASTGDQPPVADLGPQTASGGAYSVPPPPGPPPKPGEYAIPVRAGNVPPPPAAPAPAGPPMAQPAAPRGLLDTSQGPLGSSAAPPQLATPPAAGAPGPVTGLLGQQPTQQVAAADAPQLSPAAATILQGINTQQAGRGLLASGSVAGDNAVPTGGPSPAAVAQAGPPHTGAAGAAELAGLLAQPPPPQAPAAGPVPPAAAPAPAPAPAGPMLPAPGGAAPPGVAPPMPPPAMPPMPPQPVAPVAAPGPIAGAPTDRQVAAASIIAHNNIMMGKAVPPDIAAILNYKYAGPTAAATAAATAPITRANAAYEAQVKAQYDLWVKQSAPRDIRKGGISEDPITHQTLINPDTVRRTDPDTGNQYDYYSYPSLTGGAPTLVPIGLAVLGPGATSKLTETGRIQAGQEPQPAPQQPAPPLGTPPKPTYQGYPLAPGMMSKEPDYQEPQLNKTQIDAGYAAENWPKTTRELTSSIGAAQSAEQRLTTMATAFQQVGTGAFMSDKAAWNNTLDGVFGPGGGPAWLRTSTDAGAVMTSMHEAMRATLSNLKATNPRFANAEFQGLSKMSENPDLPISANLNMLAEDIGQLRQQQGLANGWIEARANGKQDPDIFQTKWLAQNKLPPIVESVKKEIGIGKMAPSGSQPQSGQSTPAQPQRAKEGDTVYAPDGSAYVIHNGVPIHKQTLQPYQSPGGR